MTSADPTPQAAKKCVFSRDEERQIAAAGRHFACHSTTGIWIGPDLTGARRAYAGPQTVVARQAGRQCCAGLAFAASARGRQSVAWQRRRRLASPRQPALTGAILKTNPVLG